MDLMREASGNFLVGTVILGFLSIFQMRQASSPFESLNSACLGMSQNDVRSPVQISQRPRAFPRLTPGDRDNPASCEMKQVPKFKPLQGNPTFFRVTTSWGRLHLGQKTQCPSHIPNAEGKLLFRCLWKVGLPLLSKTGNQFSSRNHMRCTELSSSCCTEIDIPLALRRVSQGISGCS